MEIVFLPAVIFIVSIFIPRKFIRIYSLAGISLLLLISLYYSVKVNFWQNFQELKDFHYETITLVKNWLPYYKVNLAFSITKINLMLFLLTVLLTLISSVFSLIYLENSTYYWRVKLFFLLGMELLLLSGDFIVKFIGWEFIGIASFLLISYFRESIKTGVNAVFSLFLNRVGDVLLLLGVIGVYFSTGNDELTTLFLFLGIISKSAQFPYQPWLNSAMVAPTTISALFHSATLVASGVYLLYFLETQNIIIPRNYLIIIAFITAINSSILALFQKNIKNLLAYSTISQLALMFIIFVFSPVIAVYYLVFHALFKSGLFFLSIFIYKTTGKYLLEKRILNPLEFLFTGIFVWHLAAFPGTFGNYIKSYVITDYHYLMLFVSALTIVYSTKLLVELFPPYKACPNRKFRFQYWSLFVLVILFIGFDIVFGSFSVGFGKILSIIPGILLGICIPKIYIKREPFFIIYNKLFLLFRKFSLLFSKIDGFIDRFLENVLVFILQLLASVGSEIELIEERFSFGIVRKLRNTGSKFIYFQGVTLRQQLVIGFFVFVLLLLLLAVF